MENMQGLALPNNTIAIGDESDITLRPVIAVGNRFVKMLTQVHRINQSITESLVITLSIYDDEMIGDPF